MTTTIPVAPDPADLVTAEPGRGGLHPVIRNVLSNWTSIALGVVYSLAVTPVVVRSLQAEQYGVWSFLNALSGYSELLYLGLGSALVRTVARHRAKADIASMSRLVSVVLTIYTGLGIISFVGFALVSTAVGTMLGKDLSAEALFSAQYACWFIGVRLFLTFVISAFGGLLYGYERFDLLNAVGLGGTLLRLVAVPLSVTSDVPLLTLAAATTVIAILEAVAVITIAIRVVPAVRVRLTKPHLFELKALYAFGLQSFVILAAARIISYTDTTVIGVMLGATAVTLYALPLQLVEYSRLIVGGIASVLLPRLTVMATNSDASALRAAYLLATRVGGFVSGWLVGGIISLGTAFLALWVGNDIAGGAYPLLVALGLASFFQAFSSQIQFGFYQSLELMRVPALILIVEAALNLCFSVSLAPRFGIVGVAVGTLIPAILSSAFLPSYMCRHLGVSLGVYARQGLQPGVLLLGGIVTTQAALDYVLGPTGFGVLFIRGILTIPVAAVVFTATFPSSDRQIAWGYIKGVSAAIRVPMARP